MFAKVCVRLESPNKIEDDVLVDEVDNDYTEVDNQDEIEVLEKEDELDEKGNWTMIVMI